MKAKRNRDRLIYNDVPPFPSFMPSFLFKNSQELVSDDE